jgi:hypothetical protein
MLIRDGLGKLILSAEDILCEYNSQTNFFSDTKETEKNLTFEDNSEREIYELLTN